MTKKNEVVYNWIEFINEYIVRFFFVNVKVVVNVISLLFTCVFVLDYVSSALVTIMSK